MAENLVICIARQFGSGGRHVGLGLAKAMGIAFYDKELLQAAAQKSGILQELFEKTDERPASGLMHTLADAGGAGKATNYMQYMSYQPNDRIQNAIADAIREAAAAGPCVIIGRCADYVLRGQAGMMSVFVHASFETRLKQIARGHNLDEDAARTLVRKTDRSRAKYYSFYTDRDWGAVDNYDLAVDTGRLGVDGTIALLQSAARLFCPNAVGSGA
ncbi:MAG: AAA family ATPase [Oscillospiraceae bacterium]